MYYVFDVDGTLTPSRGRIDEKFCQFLLNCAKKDRLVLVTGSDSAKTIEQIGDELFRAVDYSFNCSGNVVYHRGNLIFTSDWELPEAPWQWLENQLYKSEYPWKFGRHFEQRPGLLNFSFVGRNATGNNRTEYYEWDRRTNQRAQLCNQFNRKFPDLEAQIGGETGVDIFPKGKDKAQILDWLTGPVCFFGDRLDPEGNDRPLADRIQKDKRGASYAVRNWRDTWQLLKLMNLVQE